MAIAGYAQVAHPVAAPAVAEGAVGMDSPASVEVSPAALTSVADAAIAPSSGIWPVQTCMGCG